ncbi:hypothetical protein PN441_15335 [Spirulina major CS-329]|uniref:hypothetical protein n=1 Tax=Spirulina TaxID=1154 RepID=UPI0023315A6D|nr:hypothetical protein [Spirulina subsalsa]MDB9494034.1 hypothetical protein [Spirulina subsalsa CS-330]MDB9504449.1 hypothetical protein [Spirulina major CS-329]
MNHLLAEMIQKIQILSEPDQNRIAKDVIQSIDRILQQTQETPNCSLVQMLRLPILDEEEIICFERDKDTGRDFIL